VRVFWLHWSSQNCRKALDHGEEKACHDEVKALRMQVLKVPEARTLMLTLAATSSAQGVRGACLALKDLVVGESSSSLLAEGSSSGNVVSTLRKPAETMCKTVGVIFLIIVAMLITACADSPGFCFAM